jgi:hypothetical protein
MNALLEDSVQSAAKTVDETKDRAAKTAGLARSLIVDGLHAAASAITLMRGFGLLDALGWVGLEKRRSKAVPIAMVGAGFLVGAAAGILMAPRSGAETRRWIVEGAADAGRKVGGTASRSAKRAADMASQVVGAAANVGRS